MGSRSLERALRAEQRTPWLARLYRQRPVTAEIEHRLGSVYRASDGPLLVHFSEHPAASAWFASALAVRIGGAALVVHADADGVSTVADAVESASDLEVDRSRVGVIGEGTGAASAIAAARALGSLAAAPTTRLVLLHPSGHELHQRRPSEPDPDELEGLPPVFVQSAKESSTVPIARALEIDLREAGVAVRAVEYAGLPDGWSRYPRTVGGSRAAIDAIEGFLRRGFGVESTFGTIPGWDLS